MSSALGISSLAYAATGVMALGCASRGLESARYGNGASWIEGAALVAGYVGFLLRAVAITSGESPVAFTVGGFAFVGSAFFVRWAPLPRAASQSRVTI